MCLAMCLKNGEFQPECVYKHCVYKKKLVYTAASVHPCPNSFFYELINENSVKSFFPTLFFEVKSGMKNDSEVSGQLRFHHY